MLMASLKRLFAKSPCRSSGQATSYRPRIIVLEERITPAVITTWRGPAGGVWNNPAHWTNGIPGAADTAIFDGTANTDSTMNLVGGQDHIGKLRILDGYNHTITLQNLGGIVVDVLEMDGGTISSANGTGIWINQRSVLSGQIPPATIFGASSWTRGTISTFNLALRAEQAHPGTLWIGSAGNTVTFNALFMQISDQYGTVNWTAGSVSIAGGSTVNNFGTLNLNSPGQTFGNRGGMGARWTLQNRNAVIERAGTLSNEIRTPNLGGRFLVQAGSATFENFGDFAQGTGDILFVESGTLLITGSFTQLDGDVTVSAGTALSITSDYIESAGTMTDSGSVTVAGQYPVNGGTVTLLDGYIQATSGLQLAYGAELSGTGTIAGTFSNAGTVDVGGIGATGTLNVSGDYTQLNNGVLNMEISNAANYDVLAISGLATLDGTLNVSVLPGYQSTGGQVFSIITYGARSGLFAYINYPSYFEPRYDDPPGTISLWVVGGGNGSYYIVHHRR